MKTEGEVHQVLPNYRRFDERNIIFERSFRDQSSPAFKALTKMRQSELRHIERKDSGLELLDFALSHASFAVAEASDSNRGAQNRGFYSWTSKWKTESPLRKQSFNINSNPEDASSIVKRAAERFGAGLVGICKLDRRWVYSHNRSGQEIVFEDVEEGYETEEKMVIPNSHEYVIVMAVEMEMEEIRHSPSAISSAVTSKGYSKMSALALSVAEFIRGLGWHAIPCGNDTALSVPLGIDAGLGQQGRHARLITEKYGPSVRICKIFTDLPLATDKPVDIGVTEFCEVCKKCAIKCPAKALPMEGRTYEGTSRSNNPGVLKWYENPDRCLDYWGKLGTSCTICFRVCPFTKPPTRIHGISRWLIKHVPRLDPLFVWLDDVMRYGAPANPKEFWEAKD